MRKAAFILLVFVLVFCFVACDMFQAFGNDDQPASGQTPGEGDSSGSGQGGDDDRTETVITVDLSDIKGSSKTIEVGSNTLVSMDNLSLEDGVFLDTSMIPRSIESRAADTPSINIFKTQGGGYMMIPDLNHHGEFHGFDLGIVDGIIQLAFRVFKNIDDDLAITSEEYPDVKPADLLEEFYYVNFFDPKYAGLDPSRVVVVGDTAGGLCEFSVIQFGNYNQIKEGLLDFSLFPGFGLYLYRAIGGNDNGSWANTCYVLNPLSLDATTNASQTIGNEVAVFDVNIDDGQYYKITVHFDSFSDIERLVGNINERYYDGESRDQIMIPVVDINAKTVTYYLGAVDRPFLFTMNLLNADENAEFTFTLEASDEASFPGFVDLFDEVSEGSYIVTVPEANVGNYYTFAFRITDTGYLNTRFCDGAYSLRTYLHGKGSYSNWIGGNNLFNDDTVTGYILTDCTYNTANAELLIFDKDEPPMIECPHMIWDSELEKYVCSDGTCDVTYEYVDMFKLERTSFNGWLNATVGGHDLSIRQLMIVNVDELSFGSSENSHGSDGEYARLDSSNVDHTQRVQVSVKEMKTDETGLVTEFTGDVFLNIDSKGLSEQWFNDVTFTRDMDAHYWAMSGDLAICSVCGEERHAASTEIEMNVPCNLTVSGLSEGDKLTVIVPSLDFEMGVANGSYPFPAPDKRTIAYLIPPTSDSSVSFTKTGPGSYNIVISY